MNITCWWALLPTAILSLLLATWGCLLLFFELDSSWLAVCISLLWIAAMATLPLIFVRRFQSHKRPLIFCFVIALIMLFSWWSQLTPSHDRLWAPEVAQLLHSDIDGEQVTISNIRNFDWRTETDFSAHWQSEQFDLSQLTAADLVLSYWMGPAIAHTLVSFSFSNGQRLVFSLEIRKEQHEAFSALAGFFKQYEQVMIAATERDILYLRSNVRKEDVFLYRLNLTQPQLQTLFLAYLDAAKAIEHQADFYNTLTSNCTTVVWQLAKHLLPEGLPLDYRILLSGYLPSYVYQQGGLVEGYDFNTLKLNASVSDKAREVTDLDRYSEQIRAGVPGMQQ